MRKWGYLHKCGILLPSAPSSCRHMPASESSTAAGCPHPTPSWAATSTLHVTAPAALLATPPPVAPRTAGGGRRARDTPASDLCSCCCSVGDWGLRRSSRCDKARRAWPYWYRRAVSSPAPRNACPFWRPCLCASPRHFRVCGLRRSPTQSSWGQPSRMPSFHNAMSRQVLASAPLRARHDGRPVIPERPLPTDGLA